VAAGLTHRAALAAGGTTISNIRCHIPLPAALQVQRRVRPSSIE